mgnify:CR=1 FL=1
MALETLEDLAKELKNEDNKNVYKIFDDFVAKSNFSAEELEQKLAKEYDLDFIFINKKHKTKDISDLVKKVGYAKAANIFEQMIN